MEFTKIDEKKEQDLETITKTYLFYLSEEIYVVASELYHENKKKVVPFYKEEQRPHSTLKLVYEKKEKLLVEYIKSGFKVTDNYITKNQQEYDSCNISNAWRSVLINGDHDVILEISMKEIDLDDVARNNKGESFYLGQKIIFSLDK